MKFFIFGDEERFLLDRLRELNKNFDKETRIRFLRAEVKIFFIKGTENTGAIF